MRMIDIDSLITVREYAYRKKCSVQAVYKWIFQERIECVEICGVKFIKEKEDE